MSERVLRAGDELVRTSTADRPRRRVLFGFCAAVAGTVVVTLPVGPPPRTQAIAPGLNGRIAFESNRPRDNLDIFTVNPDGTGLVNLTDHPARDTWPAWSPDGAKLAFTSDRHQQGNEKVYVMNADGSGVTQLTTSIGMDVFASWTSDGRRIVFQHGDLDGSPPTSTDIVAMNADGTNQTVILSNAGTLPSPQVCGDSVTGVVAFLSRGDPLGTNPGNDFEVFTVTLHGAGLVQVTNDTVDDYSPKWSPDCSMITYDWVGIPEIEIHRVNADGTGDVALTNDGGLSVWSPDGTQIVFSSGRGGDSELYTASAVDGTGVVRITDFPSDDLTFDSDCCADWGTSPLVPPPTIETTASADIVLGSGQLSDVATVTGLTAPLAGATVDFRLYGPDDASCTGAPVFESLAVPYPVAGGAVSSAAFIPTAAGTYRWRATYSGDANNAAVVGECNAANQTVTVTETTPTIASADPDAKLPATGAALAPIARAGLLSCLAGCGLVGLARAARRRSNA